MACSLSDIGFCVGENASMANLSCGIEQQQMRRNTTCDHVTKNLAQKHKIYCFETSML